MKVRTKAFVQTIGVVLASVGAILLLDYISPKYGLVIYMSAIAAYMVWCLYNLRVIAMENEQEKVVDILKK